MAVRTLDLLPAVFRTSKNQKFLNATLEQATTDTDLKRLNGFVGRKFTPTIRSTDNYIPEIQDDRQNYQLEPSTVVKNDAGEVTFANNYIDLLQSIGYNTGVTNNHDRLFSAEAYTYTGEIDLDKFVNFAQYYWLPSGPDAVDITTRQVPVQEDYRITRDTQISEYAFADSGDLPTSIGITGNPTIYLARGGSYTFSVNQTGNPFWIQTELGLTGNRLNQVNISSREILGVENNGEDGGTVTFNVPQKTAQNFYLNMNKLRNVDLATDVNFNELNNQLLSTVLDKLGGIDGQRNLADKTVIFTSLDGWLFGGVYDLDGANYDIEDFDAGYEPTDAEKWGVWRIVLKGNPENPIVTFEPLEEIPVNNKVLVLEGTDNGNKEFYKASSGYLEEIPVITAILDTLYYQDGTDAERYGTIKIVEPEAAENINVEVDILGKTNYTSTQGVVFTNGLKVRFDGGVLPEEYRNKSYYVEGVGTAITLTDVSLLVTPETFTVDQSVGYDIELYDSTGYEATSNAPTTQDYIVSQRDSLDGNAWARGNRWFHIDVINATGVYNNFTPVIDQTKRGKRPIIEFNPNLQLYNFGRIAKLPVDIIDDITTDAFSNVEGVASYKSDGINLANGHRIIFTADTDDNVRNKIYTVELVDPDNVGTLQIHLSPATDSEVLTNESVVAKLGNQNQGKQFWYNGTVWTSGQQKTGVNQEPLYDVFDASGNSFGNSSAYPGTTFKGTKIFSYKKGTGTLDSVLGFALSYRNLQSVGDILYNNNFTTDTFRTTAKTSNNVDSGSLHRNSSLTAYTLANTWEKTITDTRQFQVYSYPYTGSNQFLYPENELSDLQRRTLKVYVGSTLLNSSQYEKVTVNNKQNIQISTSIDLTDKTITILTLNNNVLADTFYQIPSNLDNNSLNGTFDVVTLGQLRNHFQASFENAVGTTGVFPGTNNSRDLNIQQSQGTILQHTSGIPYAMLFMGSDIANFFDALDHANREYNNFKHKFIETAFTLEGIEYLSTDAAVDAILAHINEAKTDTFPWFYSDMIPNGSSYIENSETWYAGNSKSYKLVTPNAMNTPSQTGVLVFNNSTLLLKDKDYTISSDGLFVELTTDFTPVAGDVIKIREYSSTSGSFLPETPTKMGMYPSYQPRLLTDSTYGTSTTFIIGHDGSRVPSFGDARDDLLLEVEKRIYNNIKTVYDKDKLDLHDVLPGQFRTTDYTRQECLQILGGEFARWAGNNVIDYAKQDFFNNSNPFTYNWSKSSSAVDSELLPGYWRGVYRHYYDTDTPHLTPWECLGLAEEPSWWADAYGTAPFSAGNLVLWDDLEAGYIKEPGNERYDARYKRPGVTKYIPINVYGELRAPNEFLVKSFAGTYIEGEYVIGDEAPAETAWIKSSYYPFAVQKLLALTKPATYFGLFARTNNYQKSASLGQYVLSENNRRLTPSVVKVNGGLEGTTRQYVASYVNWISDRMRSFGVDPSITLRKMLDNLSIQLSYKMGGFTDKNYLKVLAEQSSPSSTTDSVFIPDEDYTLFLQKSNTINRLSYSAVVIEKTSSGYKVEGYDTDFPFFRVVPSRDTGAPSTLTIFDETVNVFDDFFPVFETIPYGKTFGTKQEVTDFLLAYGRYLQAVGFVFQAKVGTLGQTKTWLMSAQEFMVWAQQGWGDGNLIVLAPSFDQLDIVLENGTINNVSAAYRGSRVLDQNYNIIPTKELEIDRIDNSIAIRSSNNKTIALAVLDTVEFEHTLIPNNTTVFNDVIYQPELGNRQGRIKLVGFKSNNWDGTLTPGGFILNQDNIQVWNAGNDYRKGTLVKFKQRYYSAIANTPASTSFNTKDWKEVDYDSIKKGLLPNFANTAAAIETYYDIDDINLESDRDTFSKSLIGYKNRSYLNDLGIEDSSQIKFYQGFIQEKGTINSVNALVKANLNNLNPELNVYEEWAFRTGSYGVLDRNQVIEIETNDDTYSNTTTTVKLLSQVDSTPTDIVSVPFTGVYRKPAAYDATPFIYRSYDTDLNKDIAQAGFPRVDDINHTIFDITDIATAAEDVELFGVGQEVWVAKDWNGSWNVYRISETNTTVVKLTNVTNNFMKVTCNLPHRLVKNDVAVVKDFDFKFDATYRVHQVINEYEFTVKSTSVRMNLLIDPDTGAPGTVEGSGNLYKFVSVRYKYPSNVAAAEPLNRWKVGDKVFVDEYNTDGDWQVLEKTEPWSNNKKNTWSSGSADDLFGKSVMIGHSATWAAIGAPGESTGKVLLHDINSLNDLEYAETLDEIVGVSTDINDDFGSSLATGQLSFNYDGSTVISDEYLAVGAPATNSNRGGVFIYRLRDNTWSLNQYIPPPYSASAGAEFGKAVAISKDAKWLYIGAPGDDRVEAFGLDVALEEKTVTVEGDGSTTTYALGFTPKSLTSILVKDSTKVYRHTTDYTISGSDITFGTAPSVDVTVSENFYYKSEASLTASDGDSGDQFGASVWTSTDGTQVVVGAPRHDNAGDDSVIDSGAAYLFDRTVEAFEGDGSTTAFTTQRTLDADVNKVTVNGVLQDVRKGSDAYWDYSVSGTTLTFNTAPASSAIIKCDTNTFIQMQKMAEQTANTRGVGNEFAKSVLICPTDCSIYIGNPSDDPRELRNSGSVDRYVNQGRIFGTITSTETNPTVTIGHSIRINDFEIVFTGTAVDDVKTDINNAGIAGVTATVTSGVLTITSTSTIELQKLKVLPGLGTGLSDLGLDVFAYTQTILAPKGRTNSNFGDTLAISDDAQTLFVGAPNCTMRINMRFDVDAVDDLPDTTFDVDSTSFFDTNPKSGAAYVFEYLGNPTGDVATPGQFDFIQELEVSSATDDMAEEDRFGVSISTRGTYTVVGAEKDDEQGTDAGAVYDFDSTGVKGWKVLRSKTPQIEANAINKAYLFDKVSKEIKTYLDIYDPAKGKFIGAASQELDYIAEVDPANYDQSEWLTEYKGKYWWDTSTVRYIDYEQGNYLYKSNNWGTYFPGSSFDVYEWVETDVLPSDYVAAGYNGVPRDQNDLFFVEKNITNISTGTPVTLYYYWVGGRTTTDNIKKRLTVSQISTMLQDPKDQGIAHLNVMDSNLLSLVNCQKYIDGSNTILAVNYDTEYNEALLHNEYQLVQENKKDAELPANILSKLYDSLCGEDAYGNAVPQAGLVQTERYGIDIRPRQTMFENRGNALETFFKYVNTVMAKNQIAESRDLSKLELKEEAPTQAAGGWTESLNSYAELLFLDTDLFSDGYKVLVLADEQNNSGGWSLYELDVVDSSTRVWLQIDKQSFNTTALWSYVDWYATDFDSSTIADYSVADRNAVEALSLAEGNIVRVANRGNGLFEILRVKSDLTTEVVGLEDGTIEFSSTIWTTVQSGYWDDYNIFATGTQAGIQEVGVNINTVWGVGNADAGYGQTNVIEPKDEDSEPSTEEWNALVGIITSIGNHQNTSLITVDTSDIETELDNISTNITNVHTNRLTARATNTGAAKNIDSTGDWSESATQEIRVTFSDPDKTRYFFNAGGNITLTPDVTGYTDDAKARSWDALTQMCGTIKFGSQGTTVSGDSTSATVTETHTSSASTVASSIGYYDLTAVDQLIFTKTLTTAGSPYISTTANNVKIYAKSSGATGDNGDNGVIITFTVVYSDASDDSALAAADTMDGTVRTIVTTYEPSATYISKTWAVPAITLHSKTHE